MSFTPPKKILLVRFSALGDVIQTLPILTMLRDGFPDAKIGWAIDEELVPAIEGHRALDYIHRCPRKRWSAQFKNPGLWAATGKEMSAFIAEVKAVGYDVAVDAQGLFKTALLPFAAGIKRRIGYKHGREMSSAFYSERHLSRREYFDPAVFHLDHMAVLAKAIGAGDVRYAVEPPVVSQADHQIVERLLEGAFAAKAPILAIAPATQWESKHWPEQHWVTLTELLLAQTGLNILYVGAKSDAAVSERILGAISPSRAAGRICNITGKTSVRQMYALYTKIQAAVGSDSAPLHIAGASAVPVLIGIYGPTGYRRTPPVGSPHIKLFSTEGTLSCQPCHKRTCPLGTGECMVKVTPQEVFDSLISTLDQAGISSGILLPA